MDGKKIYEKRKKIEAEAYSSFDGKIKFGISKRPLGKSRGMTGTNFPIERVRGRYVFHRNTIYVRSCTAARNSNMPYGERPYKCHLPDCGRAFIQLSNLQQHLRNHDAQVERAKNRPFHCNICGKGFATESSLRTHTSKEKKGKSVREVEALAAQKARMQAKKEERDEETGFFQLGQVGASNLGTAASLRE
ncbi:Zinc finger protein rotund [Trachymyrmex cornetzi]|uniref:Zinc finger protein rotund n=1 Tax=Trachymyrmex cornetzi TaxID=471704 RepID=A0A195DN50_9HYME|nr:Zinc finger protein rotund [Trachymyrmex cornetzi]